MRTTSLAGSSQLFLPIVHVASHVRHNSHPFELNSGVLPLLNLHYIIICVFALFFKYYRNPPSPKEHAYIKMTEG